MVELEIQVPTPFDPFAEARESDAPGAKEYVHIRIQQRNGKKSLTTVQGLKKEFSYEKILKDLKKDFCCNGNVVQDKELGKIIQLQGDQRKNVSHFLVQAGLVRKDQIKIHVEAIIKKEEVLKTSVMEAVKDGKELHVSVTVPSIEAVAEIVTYPVALLQKVVFELRP
ncbi:hypothetical protein ACSQ67_011648 [Phaseolus vulgaris]